MQDWHILNSIDTVTQKKLLFERPISPLYKKQIAILVGPHVYLKRVSDIYQIIQKLNHIPVIIADSQASIPSQIVDLELVPSKSRAKHVFTNTDMAFELIQSCQYVIAGIDLEISSRWQLFLEQLTTIRKSHMIFTGEAVRLTSTSPSILDNRNQDVFIVNPKELLVLSKYLHVKINRDYHSLLSQLSLMRDVSQILNAPIVCIEKNKLIATDYHSPNKVVISNDVNAQQHDMILAILVGLLSDTTHTSQVLYKVLLTASLLKTKTQPIKTAEELLKALTTSL